MRFVRVCLLLLVSISLVNGKGQNVTSQTPGWYDWWLNMPLGKNITLESCRE